MVIQGEPLRKHPRIQGMDPRGMADVRELLHRLSEERGTTVFVSSHLLAQVEKLCTRVGILDCGRLVAECAVGDDLEATYLSATSEGLA